MGEGRWREREEDLEGGEIVRRAAGSVGEGRGWGWGCKGGG